MTSKPVIKEQKVIITQPGIYENQTGILDIVKDGVAHIQLKNCLVFIPVKDVKKL